MLSWMEPWRIHWTATQKIIMFWHSSKRYFIQIASFDINAAAKEKKVKTLTIFQKSDVSSTLDLLKRCSPFYHSGELTADCLNNPRPCIRVPRECIIHNAVYTILHYLTDHDFMSPENVSKFPRLFFSPLLSQSHSLA